MADRHDCIFYFIPYQFILQAQYNKNLVGKESVVNIFPLNYEYLKVNTV